MEDATLFYVEALDGGDPLKKVPFRESLKTWAAPFSDAPREARRLVHRFRGAAWTSAPGRVLVTEFDRDRRWRTTSIVDLATPEAVAKPLFDLSAQDAYGDPGRFVLATSRRGRRTILMDGDRAWLAGRGSARRRRGLFPSSTGSTSRPDGNRGSSTPQTTPSSASSRSSGRAERASSRAAKRRPCPLTSGSWISRRRNGRA